MCGLCGAVWNSHAEPIDPEALDRMTDILHHRGPDDRGTHWEPGLALGHRRLSIIDLSPQGRQPMENEDGNVKIVLNGEIYNYEPLRRRLIDQGHKFRSETDTEVLVHLYEEEGIDMLRRLNGMFAFALWDVRKRCLFIARDRIGKKPLYYMKQSGRLLFASELKSIVAVAKDAKEIDPIALDAYLKYQYIPHPQTIFRDVSKLPNGHYAHWSNDDFSVHRYWTPEWNEENDRLSYAEWSEELNSLLVDAVRIRLRSEVPLGAFLSGGIDSSIVTGIMQEESAQQIRTFSIGFHDKEYDESPYAKQIAKDRGTDHHEYFVTPDINDLLPKLVWHYDEPFADSSAIPTWYLCQMTRQEVTVALSGDGGDEMFAGYERYQAVRLGERTRHLPGFLRSFLAGPVQRCLPNSLRKGSFVRRLKRFLASLDKNRLEQYAQWVTLYSPETNDQLYTDSFMEQIAGHDPLDFLRQAQGRCSHRDAITQASLIDIQTYLPCDIMTKVDIASMAHALECRAPLLDYRIAEWTAKMPIRFKVQGNRGKVILRDTFKRFLPENIDKRKKTGFAVPLAQWFRGPLKELLQDVLLTPRCLQRGIFQASFLKRLLDDHFHGRADNAWKIWPLLVLELWFREWHDR